MKPISHGNLKNKLENKKTYLMHYQLLEHKAQGMGVMLRLNFFLFIGIYLFLHRYPITLATLDITFTVLALFYFLLFKPNMLKGKINAYYRRDYNDMKISVFLVQFFVLGGIIRFLVLSLFYGLTFYLVKDNPREVEKYKEVVMDMLINPSVSLVAIVAFGVALYWFFYHEKYVSIREFSNSVVEIFVSNPYTEEGAVHEFIRKKDEELKLFNMNGVKYDGAWYEPTPVAHNQSKPVAYAESETDETVSEEAMVSYIHEQPTEIVRRKARR